MKKKNALPSKDIDFPFVKDSKHIYNILVERGISHVDAGWAKFEFTLSSNIQYNGTECNGLTEFDKRIISLDIGLEDKLAREIVLHEYLHIILETFSLDEDHYTDGIIQINNEHLTWTLTRAFLLFKRLNPELHKLLFGE